jgi:prepilin signal peptidase PulO-like enzyme (type II secretory pathway)
VVVEQVTTVILGALVGWCLGYLSAWLTDYFQLQDGLPSARRGPFVRDLLVQVSCAAVWALLPVVLDGPWWRWAAAGLIAVPLLQVAVTDLRHRYVYLVIAGAGIVLGIALGWLVHGGEWWYGALGAAGGYLSFLALFLVGRLVYRGQEPLARGDMTIAAMVGASAGACTLSALFIGVLASGLLAIALFVGRRSLKSFMPYGPGLCLGGLVTLFRC